MSYYIKTSSIPIKNESEYNELKQKPINEKENDIDIMEELIADMRRRYLDNRPQTSIWFKAKL
jgi:hypothetical protein